MPPLAVASWWRQYKPVVRKKNEGRRCVDRPYHHPRKKLRLRTSGLNVSDNALMARIFRYSNSLPCSRMRIVVVCIRVKACGIEFS